MKLKLLIVLIIFPALCILGQTTPSVFSNPKDFCRQYPKHYKNSFYKSFSFNENKTLFYTGAIAIPVAFILDDAVREYANSNGFFSDDISNIGDVYGHRLGYYTVLSCILASDIYKGESKELMFAKTQLLLESILTSQAIIEVTKRLIGRKRPNGNKKSFPSGHSGGAFTLAACLQEFYGNTVGIPAYCMAGFVALSRINDNKHYLSDVVVGGLIGTMIGQGFSKQYHLELFAKPELNISGFKIGISYNL